jgi:hypothetical protein
VESRKEKSMYSTRCCTEPCGWNQCNRVTGLYDEKTRKVGLRSGLMGGEDLGEVVGVQRACVDCGFRWGVARSFVFLIEWAAGFATTIRKRSGDLVRRNIRGE